MRPSLTLVFVHQIVQTEKKKTQLEWMCVSKQTNQRSVVFDYVYVGHLSPFLSLLWPLIWVTKCDAQRRADGPPSSLFVFPSTNTPHLTHSEDSTLTQSIMAVFMSPFTTTSVLNTTQVHKDIWFNTINHVKPIPQVRDKQMLVSILQTIAVMGCCRANLNEPIHQ